MSTSAIEIVDLMRRSVLKVFGQRDPELRRNSIEEIYAADVRFIDPEGEAMGHDELDRAAAAILAQFPDCEFVVVEEPSVVGDLGRVTWELRTPDGTPMVRGTDIATVEYALITRMWTFLEPPDERLASMA